MRVRVLLLVLAVGCWLGFARQAEADKVKTNQPTKVYSKPGEHEKVLLKLKDGQTMTLLSKEGRWLKVRVQGRTGYVPRSKVDLPDDDEIARNTRRRPFVDGRGTKRGFGGETGPDDRVGADATGDNGGGKSDDDDDKGDKPKAKPDKPDKDDDDDDSGSKAKAKPAAKKPAAKAKAKDDDDDGDDDDGGGKAKAKPAAKKPAVKAKAKDDDGDGDDDDDGDKGKGGKAKGGKAKGGDDDDDTTVVDDDKTGEPEADARPTAHVSEKTVAHDKPNEDSDEQFTAKPNMLLYPEDKKGKWTFVSNDDGDAGWVLTSSLDIDDGGGGGGSHKKQIDTHARLGVMFLQQAMNSTGSTITGTGFNVDKYTIGTPAVAVALGGDLLVPYKKNYVLGGEASLDYAKTLLGGISIPAGATMNNTAAVNTGVSLATFNLRLVAGYDLHKKSGMTIFGRLGYRYESFMVDGYSVAAQNPAMLPQETLSAPTLGAALAMPHLTDKIGLVVSLDAVLAGASITQTKGYQDGVSPSEKAAYIAGILTYHWKKDMDLQGAYNLDIASLDFGAPEPAALNLRGHTGTDTSRSDIYHMFTFGVAKGF
ncbi:MAG TPA: SH3 domain-containing protein [Kofleriaceae bacterium]|nr:SH3 domain-containing protein [Kofleriaceae bacterium]